SNQYTVTTQRAEWNNVGTYYITLEGKNNFEGDTATIPVYITGKELAESGFTYTVTQGTHRSGEEGSVDVLVRDTNIDVTLEEGTDYTFDVVKNTWGRRYAHIIGIGNYVGTINRYYQIEDK